MLFNVMFKSRQCFRPDSDFLRQLLFFFKPHNVADISALVEACRLLQQFVRNNGVFCNS